MIAAMEVISAVQPKAPIGHQWRRDLRREELIRRTGDPLLAMQPFTAWEHLQGFVVISSVEHPTPGQGEMDLGPEYHLSMTKEGRRVSSSDARAIRGMFGLLDATEDNHVPFGLARHFWRPVADRFSGHVCPCQDSEPAIREDKGDFIWRPAPR